MLKNPHDFAPYFAPKLKPTKQKQNRVPLPVSRFILTKICIVDKKYELQTHPREESKYKCNQHTYNEFI